MSSRRTSPPAPGGPPRPVSAGRRWTPLRLGATAVGIVAVSLLIVRGLVGWNEARARSLEVACKAAHAAGRWADEERLARDWMAVAPGAAPPIFFLAQAQLGLGRQREAADTFALLPDGEPLTLQGLGDRVDLLFGDLRDPRAAAATCERILAQDPGNVEAHRKACFFSAVTLDRRRLADQAHRAIDTGGDLPETYVYLLGSNWLTLSNTLAVNSHWLQAAPDDERFLVAAARGFVSSSGLEEDVVEDGQSDRPAEPEHERQLRALLERFPSNPELLAYFLQKATTRGDLDEVTTLLAQAPREAEGDGRFWRFKGWVHDRSGEAAEAEASYRRALAIDPYDFLSRHQLAAVLRKSGRTEEAAVLARLAADGRELRKRILQAPDVRAMPPDVLRSMVDYARGCGEVSIADRLSRRIAEIAQPPADTRGAPPPPKSAGRASPIP